MAYWSSIVLVSSLMALAGCAAHAGLPSYTTVPDFTLTDQTGAQFDSATKLKHNIWIADFIYTMCPGPCPRMTSQMHQVEKALAGVENLRLVSFTVDPKNDTPAVLNQYAGNFGAEPGRWFFLTGPEPALQHLSKDVFWLGDVGGRLEHSTRFVLVDQNSKVRGFYLTEEADAIPRLIEDAKTLARSPS